MAKRIDAIAQRCQYEVKKPFILDQNAIQPVDNHALMLDIRPENSKWLEAIERIIFKVTCHHYDNVVIKLYEKLYPTWSHQFTQKFNSKDWKCLILSLRLLI